MQIPGQPQLPPSVSPAAQNLGPATAQQGNPGNAAAAMIEVQNAVKMLERALPMIPMGSPLHEKVLKVASELGKAISEGGGQGNQALELQSLIQMARQSAQSAPQNALARMFPSQGAAGAPPAMAQGGQPPQPQQAA
jgi:hypothetical protein